MEGVHPCTYVTEDVNVCILDEGEEPNEDNCWNEQNCKNRRALKLFNEEDNLDSVTTDDTVATDSASTVSPATFMTFISIASLYL